MVEVGGGIAAELYRAWAAPHAVVSQELHASVEGLSRWFVLVE